MSKFVKLSSGYDCPILGYGTFQSTDPEQLKLALKTAIHTGYRHIDTARIYNNETIIGETLEELFNNDEVKREEIFLTTKLHMSFMKRPLVIEALKKQLTLLKMSYVDLYLIHIPVATQMTQRDDTFPFDPITGKVLVDAQVKIEETWAGMEDCVRLDLARSIGVSNFNISQLQRLLNVATIKPAMNQIEIHPAFQNKKNVEFCHRNGIAVTAYSQFGSPATIMPTTGKPIIDLKFLEDDRLIAIGAKHSKTAAQVILRWLIQREIVAIPKSLTPARILENANVWDFELSQEDMAAVAAMDLNTRFIAMDFVAEIVGHPEYPHVEAGSC